MYYISSSRLAFSVLAVTQLLVRVDILFAWLYPSFPREAWAQANWLNPATYIEIRIPSHESEMSCVCVSMFIN